MEHMETELESVIKAYLNEILANQVLTVLHILESNDDLSIHDELDKYVHTPTDIMDDSERSLSLLTVTKRHGLDLLEEIGIIFDNELEHTINIGSVAGMLELLTTLNETDISDVLYLMSMKDDVLDKDFIIQLLSLNPTIDILTVANVIKDIKPTLLDTIDNVFISILGKGDVEPVKLDFDNMSIQISILDYFKEKDITLPDTIVKSLLSPDFVYGINDTYVSDIIKRFNIEKQKYVEDKLNKYIELVLKDVMFSYRYNGEDEYILLALDILQDTDIKLPEYNKMLINFDHHCTESGLYKFIDGVKHE